MTDIPNTEYITINKDGVFVGGKPAKKYRGQEIYDIDYVKHVFEWMQAQHPNIAEFQIMSSKTRSEYAETGNPSAELGPNAWCRIVLNDSSAAPWVFSNTSGSAADCALYCANFCAGGVRYNAVFRSAVLGFAAIDKQNTKTAIQPEKKSQNPELKKLEQVDFAKLPKSPIELNGYKIIVEKLAETQQNKR